MRIMFSVSKSTFDHLIERTKDDWDTRSVVIALELIRNDTWN